MEEVSAFLVSHITDFISNFGLVAIFSLMTAESALIPIPSEITMPFAGFLSERGLISFWGAVFAGTLGNYVGSCLAWSLGTHGEGFTRRFIRKWGKFVFISEHEVDIAISFYKRFGQPITFFSRLLPILRTYISLPAGIAKMPFVSFSILTLLGSFIWSTLLAYIGFTLGGNWNSIEPYFRKFQFTIVGLGLVLVAFYFYHKLSYSRKK